MRKGQAAIEFLTTYGLALMILLVVTGGLFYFGVFDMSNFVSSSCTFGNSVSCPIYSLEEDEDNFAVNIQLINILDKGIIIENMSIKESSMNEYCFSNDITDTSGTPLTTSLSRTLASSSNGEFIFEFEPNADCVFTESFTNNNRMLKYDVRLYYTSRGATKQTSVKGYIVSSSEIYS